MVICRDVLGQALVLSVRIVEILASCSIDRSREHAEPVFRNFFDEPSSLIRESLDRSNGHVRSVRQHRCTFMSRIYGQF